MADQPRPEYTMSIDDAMREYTDEKEDACIDARSVSWVMLRSLDVEGRYSQHDAGPGAARAFEGACHWPDSVTGAL
jgi:hypothetical protein